MEGNSIIVVVEMTEMGVIIWCIRTRKPHQHRTATTGVESIEDMMRNGSVRWHGQGIKELRVKAFFLKTGSPGRTCWLLGLDPRNIQDDHWMVKTNPASGTLP